MHQFTVFCFILNCSLFVVRGAEIVEVFEEGEAIPSPNEATGRFFGSFGGNFDALAYKENLLHNKISFLFSLIPRPNQWNFRPPLYPGFGAYPAGPVGVVPGFPTRPSIPPYGPAGIVPGAIPPGGFYPGGFNNPYYPGVGLPGAGGFLPGVLPVVAENNSNLTSGGSKPSQSASVAVTTSAPSTNADNSSDGADESPPAEEDRKKTKKTIKMMPKSFKMN